MTHGWLIAALLREMSRLEGKAMFECVESNFSFNRCLRQGNVETPRLWQTMATQLSWQTWRNFGQGKEWVSSWTSKEKGDIKFAVLCGLITSGLCPIPEATWKQMPRDLILETEKWSQRWTSTYELERGLIFQLTQSLDVTDFSLKNNSRSCRCAMNRQGKAHDAFEERMQSANKAWWKDVKIYRSKDVPCRIKCRTMVEHVCSVFSLGSPSQVGSFKNDEMLDLRSNVTNWGHFMSTTMKSAVHLGRKYQHNSIACRDTNFEEIKTLFDITLRLIV